MLCRRLLFRNMEPQKPSFTGEETSACSITIRLILTVGAEFVALSKDDFKKWLLAAEVEDEEAVKVVNAIGPRRLLLAARLSTFAEDMKGLGFSPDTVLCLRTALAQLNGKISTLILDLFCSFMHSAFCFPSLFPSLFNECYQTVVPIYVCLRLVVHFQFSL